MVLHDGSWKPENREGSVLIINKGFHLFLHSVAPIICCSEAFLTSVQAAGHVVAFAGGALEQRGGSDDLGARSAGLSLRPAAVAELGAEAEELLWGSVRGHEPVTRLQTQK